MHPAVHAVGAGMGGNMSLGVPEVPVSAAAQGANAYRGGRGAPAGTYGGHKAAGTPSIKAAARGVEEIVPSALGRSSLLEEFRNNKNRKFTLQV